MTDDEIAKLCREWPNNATQAARAILAAHTAKLLAGVEMPEHCDYQYVFERVQQEPFYTKDQLQAYAAAAAAQAREKALEEAAVEFEGLYSLGGDDIAKCLRQMKEQP